jgi:hypothetical protein
MIWTHSNWTHRVCQCLSTEGSRSWAGRNVRYELPLRIKKYPIMRTVVKLHLSEKENFVFTLLILSMRWWIFGFHKMLGSSRVAAQLAASREGLGSMSEWVILSDATCKFVNHCCTPHWTYLWCVAHFITLEIYIWYLGLRGRSQ